MALLLDSSVSFLRNVLLALQRFKSSEDNILGTVVSLSVPFAGPAQGKVEVSLFDALTVLVLMLSSLLFIRSGFTYVFDSVGCLRELHKWKRWGKKGQSSWTRSEPAQIMLYFTVNAAMKTKRQLIFIGLAHLLFGHLFLVFAVNIADPSLLESTHRNTELTLLFLYCLALTMGLKITWDLIVKELNLILDMRVAWAWATSKLNEKAYRDKRRIKLNDVERKSPSLVYDLFSDTLDGDDNLNTGIFQSTAAAGSSGYSSGGYSSGEETRRRRVSRTSAGVYRVKMDALQRKSSACAALLNLFSLRAAAEPCGPFGPFSVQATEDTLASISLDLASLEVNLIESAQKQVVSERRGTAAGRADDDGDAVVDVAGVAIMAKRYIRQKNRIATFYLCLWILNAVAIIGLAFAIMTFFEPITVLRHLLGPSVFKTQGREDGHGHGQDGDSLIPENWPLVSNGLLVADIALAFEALAILSRQM